MFLAAAAGSSSPFPVLGQSSASGVASATRRFLQNFTWGWHGWKERGAGAQGKEATTTWPAGAALEESCRAVSAELHKSVADALQSTGPARAKRLPGLSGAWYSWQAEANGKSVDDSSSTIWTRKLTETRSLACCSVSSGSSACASACPAMTRPAHLPPCRHGSWMHPNAHREEHPGEARSVVSGVAVGRDGAGAVAAVASPSERVGTSVRGAQIELGSPATLADLLLALVDYLYYQLVVVYSTAVGALRMLAGGLGMMMTRATVLSAQVTGAEQQQQQQVHKEQEGLRKPVVGESQSQARAKAGAAPFADFGAIESPESLRHFRGCSSAPVEMHGFLSEAMWDDLEWFQNEEEKHLRHQIQELEGVRSELQLQHAAYLLQIRSMRACLRSAPGNL